MDVAVQCTMCRICMRSTSERVLIGLFEHIVQTQSLARVVSLVGAVEVQQDDELPKLCCTQCLREVEAAYKLRNLCQESDAKLRSQLPNKAAVVKNEPFSDDELISRDPEGLASSDEFLAPEKLHSLTPDAIKHEYEEITIEETRIIDASESNQCSESKNSISFGVEKNGSNYQELEAEVSENKPRKVKHYRVSRILDEYPAVKLSCCGCISSFDTIEELRSHGREKHCNTDLKNLTLKERQCDICFKVLRNGRTYDFHKKNVMYNYRCKICDEILITLKQASVHYRLKHAQRNPTADQALICCGCKMRFSSAEELMNHSQTIHFPEKPSPDEEKPFTCSICYRNYTTQRALRQHKIGYLQETKHQCKECGKSLCSASVLRHHEQSHTRETTFSCSQCPKVYFHYSSFRLHLYTHSQPSDKYRCNECGRSFRNKTLLTDHSWSHKGERPFSCVQCSATFKRKSHLTNHITTHDDQQKYPCSQCDRQFKTKHSRYYHIRSVHDSNSDKYQCNDCGRSFLGKAALTQHIRSHTGERPYQCKECEKSFSTKRASDHHARTHATSMRPPSCQP